MFLKQSGPQSWRNIRAFCSAEPCILGSTIRWRYRIPLRRVPVRNEDSSHVKTRCIISSSLSFVSLNPGVSTRTYETPLRLNL
jgi:hypothetical protein